MAWIPVDQSLVGHRKTLRLARELGVSQTTAIGHLIRFWLWCADNAPTGKLTGIDPQDIAYASGTNRGSVNFFDALVTCGFVDKRGHGTDRPPDFQIHDWEQFGGKLWAERAKNRQRMKAARAVLEKNREE